MKKPVVLIASIAVITILAWMLFYPGSHPTRPRLLRLPLGEPVQWSDAAIQAAGFTPPLRAGKDAFFETGNLSLRGHLLHIPAGGRRFSLEPAAYGPYIAILELFSSQSRPIGLQIYLDRELKLKIERLQPGFNPIRLEMDLRRRSKVDIVFTGSGTLLSGELLLSAATPLEKRDYVFLFCADTLRADHLPVYGYKRETAPNIKAFADDAVVFDYAFAQSSWTLPSHMSLFTGRNEYAHGVKRGSMLSSSVPYLVEQLAAGTLTRSINGGIYVSSRFGFSRGFDSFLSIPGDQLDPGATEKLADLAATALERDAFAEGFYFLHTYQVHSPYNPALKYLAALGLHPPEKILVAPTVPSNHREQFVSREPGAIQNFIDLYDAEILALDEGFGKFLRFLKQNGIYQRSMIIFFSDHGEEFFDHQGWGHGHSLYNELIRVPLLVKFPENRFAGKRVGTPVGLVDIMPTVMEHRGIPLPAVPLDGCSLTRVIRNGSREKPLLSSLTSGRYVPELPFKISLIEGVRKLLYNLPYTRETLDFFEPDPPDYQRYEVYNIAADPGEKTNIHLRFRRWIHSFHELFKVIVTRARANLQHTGRRVIMDEKMKEAFKSLGYL